VNAALSGPSKIEPGHRLDRYELLCPIAEGGMASVWLARVVGKRGFEKLVAIKTILPKFASDGAFEEMLLDEARIASQIDHNNVARILDLGEYHEALYLVLEWVEGESLSRLDRAVKKQGRTIPHGILLRILADACGGLHAAHELRGADGKLLGVIHRDVSPQNILVSNTGTAKLIDFGIAKARDRLSGETGAGVLKGKVRYMAPEQALGRPVDRRADLFAVGSVLYRLLSGKAPFQGENDLATLSLLTTGKPPAALPASIHPSIVAVVNRALSHAPEGRFATAMEMQSAIEGAMIDAGLATTTSHVATFTTEHLAPYTARRQASIQLAMEAAGERERMRGLLKPLVNPEPNEVSEMRPADSSERTIVDDGENEVTGQHRAAIARPMFVAPPMPDRTFPPTSDAPPDFPPPARKTTVIAAGAVVTFLIVLLLFALAGRAHTKTAAARPPPATPTQTVAAPPVVAPTIEPEPASSVPTVVATDLPLVKDPEPVTKVRPPPRVSTDPSAKPAVTDPEEDDSPVKATRHNDGF
jgi:eukaryotic-like serine/threonine-protein kinase